MATAHLLLLNSRPAEGAVYTYYGRSDVAEIQESAATDSYMTSN